MPTKITSDQQTGKLNISTGPFSIWSFFDKSRDAHELDQEGEDYITLIFTSRQVTFSLCDGVSKSFFGSIGSKYLGDMLVEWLNDESNISSSREISISIESLIANITSYLNENTDKITRHLKTIALDQSDEITYLPLVLRREERGTQSNFVCGRIDAPSTQFPQGRIILLWLGDAKLHIWRDAEIDVTEMLGAEWRKEAWTSLKGVAGTIDGYIGNLSDVDCIMAYSDGMDRYSSKFYPGMSQKEILEFVLETQHSPVSDDISFIQIDVDKSYPPFDNESQEKNQIAVDPIREGLANLEKDVAVIKSSVNELISSECINCLQAQNIKKIKRFVITACIVAFILWFSLFWMIKFSKPTLPLITQSAPIEVPVNISPTPTAEFPTRSTSAPLAPDNREVN